MGPAQRTILRVVAGVAFLAIFGFYLWQVGAFEKIGTLPLGIALVAMGALSAVFGTTFRRENYALQERLTPVVGYPLPRWAQPLTWLAIIACGVALIVKSLYF